MKLYTCFFHGLESILPRPVAIMNRGRRVYKQFFQMIQEQQLGKTSLATTRGADDQNTRGYLQRKRFSPLYSICNLIILFGRKCDRGVSLLEHFNPWVLFVCNFGSCNRNAFPLSIPFRNPFCLLVGSVIFGAFSHVTAGDEGK